MLKQADLKKIADECAQKIRDCKHTGQYAAEPFQHFQIDNFFPEMVKQAKALAEKDPHPFWAIRMRQSQLSREARYGR